MISLATTWTLEEEESEPPDTSDTEPDGEEMMSWNQQLGLCVSKPAARGRQTGGQVDW